MYELPHRSVCAALYGSRQYSIMFISHQAHVCREGTAHWDEGRLGLRLYGIDSLTALIN